MKYVFSIHKAELKERAPKVLSNLQSKCDSMSVFLSVLEKYIIAMAGAKKRQLHSYALNCNKLLQF